MPYVSVYLTKLVLCAGMLYEVYTYEPSACTRDNSIGYSAGVINKVYNRPISFLPEHLLNFLPTVGTTGDYGLKVKKEWMTKM